MAEGGTESIADRARNDRLTRIVDAERLTRMQGLLRANGIAMSKRQLAMDQNGDLSLNLTPQTAAQMWRAGLINESQLGAVANGGHARFSFAGNDLLVSSSAGFQQSARSDTSTRFEAGKQAGPDTIEHFLGGGQEGHDMMARWLKGGFEMDRHGQWRLKPQVADTLQRDVQAVMSQTGWTRSLARSADHQISDSITFGANISGRSVEFGRSDSPKGAKSGAQASGQSGFQLSGRSSDTGTGSTRASATIDIVNYDVRAAIAKAEQRAARSNDPHQAFTHELSEQILGTNGMRNRYLGQADAGRSTFDPTAPVTSFEQSKVLDNGRFSGDLSIGPGDGDPTFKKR
ncbi:hypothetical protein [Sphingobium sp. EM0848]|uniref:hypothetical protein n=1 Tax=Sphingobium sp. EM0848 TaxID=2743473 RepID=UPI001C3F7D44